MNFLEQANLNAQWEVFCLHKNWIQGKYLSNLVTSFHGVDIMLYFCAKAETNIKVRLINPYKLILYFVAFMNLIFS